MKYFITASLFVLICGTLAAQDIPVSDVPSFRETYASSFEHSAADSPLSVLSPQEIHNGTKSRFLGVVYSLLLPGMGELYAGKFERGQVPLIIEGFLWLGFAGLNYYGAWIEDASLSFATQHSGANFDGKNEDYQVDVENFIDIHAYNNYKLVDRDLNALYPIEPEAGYFWKWDSDANREKFEQLRIKSDDMFNATSFVVLGMIANRIWSAIKASLAVRDYNNELQTSQYYLPDFRSQITQANGRIDGLEFQIRQPF